MFEANFYLQINMLDGNNYLQVIDNEISQAKTEQQTPICQPRGLSKRLHKLICALKLEQSNIIQLKKLFSSENKSERHTSRVFSIATEVAFSFWGYIKSEENRVKFLGFLLWLFDPRVYMTASSKNNFLEGVMIIDVHRFKITPEAFESWLECFLAPLQMSAGSIVFTEYLGDQMLSCMDRIYSSDKLRHNLFYPENRDFRMLYKQLLERNNNQNKVLQATGLHFTSNNFINIFANQTRQPTENIQTHGRSVMIPLENNDGHADWNWRILLRTVDNEDLPVITGAEVI